MEITNVLLSKNKKKITRDKFHAPVVAEIKKNCPTK